MTAADLEVYRLVMLPATFQKLCHRLDAEVANLTRDRQRSGACPELPFGADLASEVAASMAAERRRRWAARPNGEPYPLTWSIHPEFRLPGRARLLPGREFSVRGERGRFRFRHAVTTDTGETWVDAWDGEGRCRSLRPERIRVVHVKSKVRPPANGCWRPGGVLGAVEQVASHWNRLPTQTAPQPPGTTPPAVWWLATVEPADRWESNDDGSHGHPFAGVDGGR